VTVEDSRRATIYRLHDEIRDKDDRIAALEAKVKAVYVEGWDDGHLVGAGESKERTAILEELLRECYGYTTAAGDLLPERIKAALKVGGEV
jgi:hypothetical protein